MAEMRLKGKLTMDDSQFQAVLRRSQANAAKFASSLGRGVAVAGAVGFAATTAAVLATSAALGAAVKQALDLGGKFSDLRSRTGASVKSLTIWSQALDDAGIGGDQLGGIINKLQKAIESGNPAIEKMGLNLDELRKLAPDQQLARVGAAIVALKSPSQQTAAAMQIFGKSGGQLLTVFKDTSALENARNVLGSMPDILDANADRYDKVSDSIANLQKKWTAFGVGLASAIPEDFDKLLDKILGADTAKVGASLGKDIASAFENQSIYAAIATLAGNFIKLMTSATQSVADVIVSGLTSAFSEAITDLQARIELITDLVSGLGDPGSTISAMNAINSNERQIRSLEDDQANLDKRAPGSGARRKYTPWHEGAPGSGELSKEEYDRRKSQIDEAKAAAKARIAEQQSMIVKNGGLADLEERKARIREQGGPRVGFANGGQGLTAEERVKQSAGRIAETGGQVAPSTTAAVSGEAKKMATPKKPTGFDSISPQYRAQLIGSYRTEEAARAAYDQQTSAAAATRAPSQPSVMSVPSVRPPGQARTTVARQERATKILGAEATRRKKAAEAEKAKKEQEGDALKKIASTLESWDE